MAGFKNFIIIKKYSGSLHFCSVFFRVFQLVIIPINKQKIFICVFNFLFSKKKTSSTFIKGDSKKKKKVSSFQSRDKVLDNSLLWFLQPNEDTRLTGSTTLCDLI